MQAKGQGKTIEYNHDISNCPQMIAKFSNINLDQESDTEDNQEYVNFYGEQLWLDREHENSLPKINNICAKPINNLSNRSLSRTLSKKQPIIPIVVSDSSSLSIPFKQKSGLKNVQETDSTLSKLKLHIEGSTIPVRKIGGSSELKDQSIKQAPREIFEQSPNLSAAFDDKKISHLWYSIFGLWVGIDIWNNEIISFGKKHLNSL